MEQGDNDKIPKNDDKKMESIFWSIVFGSLLLLAVVICVGLYLMAQDLNELVSYVICLGIAAMGTSIVYGPLRRYLKIPIWSWSVSRCTADKMNKTQKSCMWLGMICSFAGAILVMNHVAWRWIFVIRGDRLVGSLPAKISWVGLIVMLAGICILRISLPRDNKNSKT